MTINEWTLWMSTNKRFTVEWKTLIQQVSPPSCTYETNEIELKSRLWSLRNTVVQCHYSRAATIMMEILETDLVWKGTSMRRHDSRRHISYQNTGAIFPNDHELCVDPWEVASHQKLDYLLEAVALLMKKRKSYTYRAIRLPTVSFPLWLALERIRGTSAGYLNFIYFILVADGGMSYYAISYTKLGDRRMSRHMQTEMGECHITRYRIRNWETDECQGICKPSRSSLYRNRQSTHGRNVRVIDITGPSFQIEQRSRQILDRGNEARTVSDREKGL